MVAFLRFGAVGALVWILHALHSAAAEGESIEKVSYLLQYGPGVHTVFEVEGNPSDKPPVMPTGSSIGPSSSALHQPRTTTMRSDLNTVTIGTIEVASSAPQGAAGAAHRLESETADDGSAPSSPGEGPSVTGEGELTTARAVGLINTATSIVSSASTYLSSSLDPQKGSQDDDDDGVPAIGAGSERPSSGGAPVARVPTLLPPPPVLPNFGSMLNTDVMVNLKPKELRALMSTYIALIETYKSFNQQQRRNIARLTKELQSLEKAQLRART